MVSFMGVKCCITVESGCSSQHHTCREWASIIIMETRTTMRFAYDTLLLNTSPDGFREDRFVADRPMNPQELHTGAFQRLQKIKQLHRISSSAYPRALLETR